jgi:uncharacterized membrane protein YbhN (UPF0104 family)
MTTAATPKSAPSRQLARRLVAVLLATGVIASLLLAVPGLQGVAKQLDSLNTAWVLAAVGLELASCLGFVVVFRLFFEELPAGPARALAWTEQGAGALLPGGGVGALAVGGWLLHQRGIAKRRVIERSSALFFLTSATNVAALVLAGGLLAAGLVAGPHDPLRTVLPLAGGLLVAAVVLITPAVTRRSSQAGRPSWVGELGGGIDGARDSLARPSWRLLGAIGYLGFDIAALGAALAAAGRPVPVAPLVLAYLIGYLANLIPVPGGFGVLEGGLAGALIAYHAPATQAAAAVVVYHAIAFWIPSLGGLLGYALLRDQSQRLAPRRRRALRAAHAAPSNCSSTAAALAS